MSVQPSERDGTRRETPAPPPERGALPERAQRVAGHARPPPLADPPQPEAAPLRCAAPAHACSCLPMPARADKVGALLMMDMAHISGLVAAGEADQVGSAFCRNKSRRFRTL